MAYRNYRNIAEHGTRARYRRGCRCDQCRAANSAYELSRRKGAGLDRAVARIVAGAGRLNPEQLDLLRSLLPEPTEPAS